MGRPRALSLRGQALSRKQRRARRGARDAAEWLTGLGGQLPLGADPTLDTKAQRSLSAPLKPQRDARFVLAMHATI